MSYRDLGLCLCVCAFWLHHEPRVRTSCVFVQSTSVSAAGLAVGGVASCFAGNAEGLLRPPTANDEVDLRMLSRPRAGSPTFAKTLVRPRGGFCRPHRVCAMVMFAKMLFPDFRGIHGAESCSGHSFFPIARFRGRFRQCAFGVESSRWPRPRATRPRKAKRSHAGSMRAPRGSAGIRRAEPVGLFGVASEGCGIVA